MDFNSLSRIQIQALIETDPRKALEVVAKEILLIDQVLYHFKEAEQLLGSRAASGLKYAIYMMEYGRKNLQSVCDSCQKEIEEEGRR